MLKVIQINLHHFRTATSALAYYIISEDLDIPLIQEPWVHQNSVRGLEGLRGYSITVPQIVHPRTCIISKESMSVIQFVKFCSRDFTAFQVVVVEMEGTSRELVLAACYLPYDQATTTQRTSKAD